MRHLWTLLGLLLVLTPLAGAQQKASAELHHRATDLGVELRIDIDIASTWHLGHTELGARDGIGTLTTVEIDTIGAVFDEVRFPEPHKTPQEFGALGRPTWIWSHSGEITLWAFGYWEDEPDPEIDLWVTLAGQTCSDLSGQCIPYEEELDSLGAGDDALWADFPDDLRVVPEPVVEEEDSGFGFGGGQDTGGGFGFGFGGGLNEATGTLWTRVEGERVLATIEVDIHDGWHLNHDDLGWDDAVGIPTTVELSADNVTWLEPLFPEPHPVDQPFGLNNEPTQILVHSGTIRIHAEGVAEGEPGPVTVKLVGQTCSDDEGTCLDYEETLTSAGAGADEAFAVFAVGTVEGGGGADGNERSAPAEGGPEGHAEDVDWPVLDISTNPVTVASMSELAAGNLSASARTHVDDTKVWGGVETGLWAFILLCIGGGLFTLLMPCTYPMIPITISFFTKKAEEAGKPPVGLSLAYGLGIIAVFVLVGLVVGQPIISFATHWVTNLVIGGAFLYFAFVLMGFINLQPPRFLMNLAGGAQGKGGLFGVFLMGATLVVTSFTCTAPILGAILAAGAGSESADLGRVAIGMFFFGLTMAVPFVALSLIPGKLQALPSSGQWMNTLKVTLGFVELAAAFKFLSNADIVLQLGVLPDELLLVLWAAVLGFAGLFLLGAVAFKKERLAKPGMARAGFGIGFAALAVYFLALLPGTPRDFVMSAFLPGYGPWVPSPPEHVIRTDAFDQALAQARAEDKLLLVNLTGFS